MMKYRNLLIFSIIFLLTSSNLFTANASELLIKYNMFYLTDPATGLRIDDGNAAIKSGYNGRELGDFPGATTSVDFKYGGTMHTITLDPNNPQVGYPDDCYPDDSNNPEGNIVISGKIISNFTNKPVNGAVVAIYMGSEHLNNKGNDNQGGAMPFNERFVVGGKDVKGRLTNLYHYDISKDGEYRVYACNGYKPLSTSRKQELQKLFNVDRCPEGYVDSGQGCNHFDYVKAYPKFNLAVVCGMSNTQNSSLPSPIIGEVYSIDNNNDSYKGPNPPNYVQKRNFDIKVNCPESIAPFPLPMNLDYASPSNVASCRMDDISSNLKNYFNSVQKNIRNYAFVPSTPENRLVPSLDQLPTCTNPDDIFCLKNFLTKSFQKPELGKNVFNYGAKTYLNEKNVNPNLRQEVFKYSTAYLDRKIDLSDAEGGSANERNFLPKNQNSTFGQFDAKADIKSYINDVKFDLSTLKDLYACFTTFNAPKNKTSALRDEEGYAQAQRTNSYYTPNIRVPFCRELYCGQEFVPDNEVCRVKKPEFLAEQAYGTKFNQKYSDKYIQLNALTGYGPGVTLSLESQKDISQKLLLLVKDLINSDFNPKKPEAGAKYKPVQNVSDVVGCLNDDGTPVYLNDNSKNQEGSISYKVKGEVKTFYSPVPLMSFISIPYNIELFHSIVSDNYKNQYGQNGEFLFPEQCNSDKPDQKFANCRTGIIPGGVYSISALRLIANMCNAATKIPTPDAGTFTRIMGVTGESSSSQINKSLYTNVKDVELSVTKVGTPVSVCLCKTGDYNCNNATKLNNQENPSDFAISSFIGEGGQNNGNNYLGVFCKNDFPNTYDKNPKENCRAIAASNSNKNVPENSVNFEGNKGNLQVKWSYSYAQFDEGPDANHEWLSYQWDGGYRNPTPSNTPQVNNGELKSVASIWKAQSAGNLSDACIKGIGSGCLSYPRLNYDYNPKVVSKVESAEGYLNRPDAATGVAPLSYYDAGAGESNNFVKEPFKVVQKTHDGTTGYVKATFEFNNAIYDPIPDLLNDFRRYSVYGAIPGGDEYCRSPKIASVFDFVAKDYDVENDARGGGNVVQNRAKGVYCNAAISDEMKRCDNPKNWVTENERTPEDCRYYKCLSFCQQLTGTYYMFMDPNTQNYYCLVRNPNQGVEMQMNTGDEGCVLDYVQRMKTVYAVPAEVPSDYRSVRGDAKYDKSNYPVYNNVLCDNPSISNPLDPNYKLNGKTCMPFVGKTLLEGAKFNKTQFNFTTPINQ